MNRATTTIVGRAVANDSAIQHRGSGLRSSLASRLRRWRKEKRIPLKQMAADLKVSVSIISAWEQGARFPSASHLERLAAYMGLRTCQLIYSGPGDCAGSRC